MQLLNRVEYYGDDMSSGNEDGNNFTPTVTPVSDESDSNAEESEGASNAGTLIVHNIYC